MIKSPLEIRIPAWFERYAAGSGTALHNQVVLLHLVFAANATSRHDGSVSDSARSHQTPLPSQENRGLVQHDPFGDIPHKRWCGLILIGGIVEVYVRAAHLTMILSTGTAGHQTVAKINQAAQGDIWKQYGLFQSNGMRNIGLFFQNCPLPHMGTQSA